ncbi:MAG: carbonic anhydrase [Candidatus Sericytochromatia bacterium]
MSDPVKVWQSLRTGNERFFIPVRSGRHGMLADRPVAAVFGCSDSGLSNEMVFGQSWGSLLNVSTWAHVVDTGVLATLEHAVQNLKVPLIVVLGHDDCQAMRAAIRAWEEAVLPDGATRHAVEHAMWSIVRRDIPADSVQAVAAAHAVETGLSLVQRSPAIARHVDERACAIVCATIDPVDGRLRTHATIGAVEETNGVLVECV